MEADEEWFEDCSVPDELKAKLLWQELGRHG